VFLAAYGTEPRPDGANLARPPDRDRARVSHERERRVRGGYAGA